MFKASLHGSQTYAQCLKYLPTDSQTCSDASLVMPPPPPRPQHPVAPVADASDPWLVPHVAASSPAPHPSLDRAPSEPSCGRGVVIAQTEQQTLPAAAAPSEAERELIEVVKSLKREISMLREDGALACAARANARSPRMRVAADPPCSCVRAGSVPRSAVDRATEEQRSAQSALESELRLHKRARAEQPIQERHVQESLQTLEGLIAKQSRQLLKLEAYLANPPPITITPVKQLERPRAPLPVHALQRGTACELPDILDIFAAAEEVVQLDEECAYPLIDASTMPEPNPGADEWEAAAAGSLIDLSVRHEGSEVMSVPAHAAAGTKLVVDVRPSALQWLCEELPAVYADVPASATCAGGEACASPDLMAPGSPSCAADAPDTWLDRHHVNAPAKPQRCSRKDGGGESSVPCRRGLATSFGHREFRVETTSRVPLGACSHAESLFDDAVLMLNDRSINFGATEPEADEAEADCRRDDEDDDEWGPRMPPSPIV